MPDEEYVTVAQASQRSGLSRRQIQWLFAETWEGTLSGRMPTFEAHDRFRNEHRGLSAARQQLFSRALDEFIEVFLEWEKEQRPGIPRFPARLRVKSVQGHPRIRPRIMELSWAGDGRCTWQIGISKLQGKYHVIWRRIGSHAIFDDP